MDRYVTPTGPSDEAPPKQTGLTLIDAPSAPYHVSSAYEAALVLVERIETQLAAGCHYRDTNGQALTTLDEVVLAIIEERWPVDA